MEICGRIKKFEGIFKRQEDLMDKCKDIHHRTQYVTNIKQDALAKDIIIISNKENLSEDDIVNIKCAICGRVYTDRLISNVMSHIMCECKRPDKGIVGWKKAIVHKVQMKHNITFVETYGFIDTYCPYPWMCNKCGNEFWSNVNVMNNIEGGIVSACINCTIKNLKTLGYKVEGFPFMLGEVLNIKCPKNHKLELTSVQIQRRLKRSKLCDKCKKT